MRNVNWRWVVGALVWATVAVVWFWTRNDRTNWSDPRDGDVRLPSDLGGP